MKKMISYFNGNGYTQKRLSVKSEAQTNKRYRVHFIVTLAIYFGLVILPHAALAQWSGEFRMHMGYGGDKLATVEYSDGSESSLRLGTYYSFVVGPIYKAWSSGPSSIELQAMTGWSGWSTGPENTDDRLKLNRFPLELLVFYGHAIPEGKITLRFGGGLTWHFIGGVKGTGSLDDTDIGVDNALGGVAEIAVISDIITAGLRYTQMNVSVGELSEPMSGSSFGLFLGLAMPRSW